MTGRVVLVVDDEAPMRRLLAVNLRARGYEVLTAADGIEALALLAGRPVDLILLDMLMPGPDGLHVLDQFRRIGDTPVIVLSASTREADRIAALARGADDYLLKPFSIDELLARVRAAPATRRGSIQGIFRAERTQARGDSGLRPEDEDTLPAWIPDASSARRSLTP